MLVFIFSSIVYVSFTFISILLYSKSNNKNLQTLVVEISIHYVRIFYILLKSKRSNLIKITINIKKGYSLIIFSAK